MEVDSEVFHYTLPSENRVTPEQKPLADTWFLPLVSGLEGVEEPSTRQKFEVSQLITKAREQCPSSSITLYNRTGAQVPRYLLRHIRASSTPFIPFPFRSRCLVAPTIMMQKRQFRVRHSSSQMPLASSDRGGFAQTNLPSLASRRSLAAPIFNLRICFDGRVNLFR